MCQGFRALRSPKAIRWRSGRQSALSSHAETVGRRDQRAVCCAPRTARCPVPLSTTPVPLRKPRARHERHSFATSQKRRLPSVARRRALRSVCVSLCAPLRLRSTFPARRPQTEALWPVLLMLLQMKQPQSSSTAGRILKCPQIRCFHDRPLFGIMAAFRSTCVWLFAFFLLSRHGWFMRNQPHPSRRSCPSVFVRGCCGWR